jgi:hypothetical protein
LFEGSEVDLEEGASEEEAEADRERAAGTGRSFFDGGTKTNFPCTSGLFCDGGKGAEGLGEPADI